MRPNVGRSRGRGTVLQLFAHTVERTGITRTVGITLPVNDLLGSDMGGVTTPDRNNSQGAARTEQGRSRTVGITLPVNDLRGSDMGGVTTPDRNDSQGAARTEGKNANRRRKRPMRIR
jgi:hypothetical protein